MWRGLLFLAGLYWASGLIINWFNLPLPASIAGLLIALVMLMAMGHIPDWLLKASNWLLPFMPLFLISPSVGVVNHWQLLADDGMAIGIALLVSLVLTTLLIPFLFRFFLRIFKAS